MEGGNEMAKKLVYPATFTQDGEYIFVEFPDVDGAVTPGENLQEAYEMAEEVLGVILADNKEYPVPSTVKEIATLYPNSDVALVGVDINAFRRKYRSKTIRKNITLPEWLNDLAVSEKINVSQIATEALKEKLKV